MHVALMVFGMFKVVCIAFVMASVMIMLAWLQVLGFWYTGSIMVAFGIYFTISMIGAICFVD